MWKIVDIENDQGRQRTSVVHGVVRELPLHAFMNGIRFPLSAADLHCHRLRCMIEKLAVQQRR